MTTLKTEWGGNRVHLSVWLDQPRHERLLRMAEEYSETIGRPVSLSLLFIRAVDLLDKHHQSITNDPAKTLTERLELLGKSRKPKR